jgi:2-isopropylmalate synthase
LTTHINSRLIYPTSRLVSDLTGIAVQPNKALVGDNAFAYTSGVYERGVLKGRGDYEIIDPAEIGILESEVVLSARLGLEDLQRRLLEMGYALSGEELARVYARFKGTTKKKSAIDIRDLEAIVTGETTVFLQETYELEDVQVTCGTGSIPMAAVRLRGLDGESVLATAYGNGPVDAAYKAIDSIVKIPSELVEFTIQAMTEGLDALGKVTVRIRVEVPVGDSGKTVPQIFIGRGADTDIIVASVKAYLFALNRLLAAQQLGSRAPVSAEVQASMDRMQAIYGTGYGDFMGMSTMRDELLE